jgi:hypothetical protein
MSRQRDEDKGWFSRWREQRRRERQDARERQYFAHENARSDSGALATAATDRLNVSTHTGSYTTTSTGWWGGFGGDGGGADGGGGC